MDNLIGQEEAWRLLLEDRHNKISKQGVKVYNPNELQSPELNLSVILKVPEESNEEIYKQLTKAIPLQYHQHLLLQNPEWYHLTIQWVPDKEIPPEKRPQLISDVKDSLQNTSRIKGVVRFPCLADGGFLAGFFSDNDGEVATLKRKISSIWGKHGIKLYLPEIYDEVAYISQSRFIKPVDQIEIIELLKVTQQEVEITLKAALIVLNDKIMTPERTKIIETVYFN